MSLNLCAYACAYNFNKVHLEEELRTDFLSATDMADYLVRKGTPFREAHEITGKVVAYCISRKMYFGNLDVETLKQFSAKFDADVLTLFCRRTA